MSETEPAQPTGRSAQFIIFLVVFIDLFGFGIVLPLLPRYGEDFIADPRWRGPLLGLLMSSFSAMQFFFAPVWGRVSDRVGRRPILLMGLASSVVFYSIFGVASTLGREGSRGLGLALLFAARIGAGIAGATLGTAQAAIADSTSAQGRSRGMALIGMAFGIGFFFGPLLAFGALTVAPGYAGGPGYLAAGLSFLALVLGFLLLPETRRAGHTLHHRRLLDPRAMRIAWEDLRVGRLILIYFLSTVAFASFEPTLALLTKSGRIALTDRINFLLFAYVGFVLGAAQGGLYRPLARRVSEYTFTWIGLLLMAAGLLGVGVVASLAGQSPPPRPAIEPASAGGIPTPVESADGQPTSPDAATLLAALLGILAIAVTGFAFVTPSVSALISRLSDPTRQGEILGVNQSASAMARILGPAAGVPLYFLTPAHTLPYVFGAALLAVALVLVVRLRHAIRT